MSSALNLDRLNANPNLYVLGGKPKVAIENGVMRQESAVAGQKSYFQIFTEWFNEKANAQVVFKFGRQIVDLAEAVYQSSDAQLHKLGSLFSELRKGFALGYLFTQINAVLYAGKGESWTKRFTNYFELAGATFLNISIFVPVIFNRAVEWTTPAMNWATLGADGTKIYETGSKMISRSQYTTINPTSLKVAGLALSIFGGVVAVSGFAVLTKAALAFAAVSATGLKLSSSFWEYVQEAPVTPSVGLTS